MWSKKSFLFYLLQLTVLGIILAQKGCRDDMSSGNCLFYKNRGYCKVADWLRKRCTKTCGLCETSSTTSPAVTHGTTKEASSTTRSTIRTTTKIKTIATTTTTTTTTRKATPTATLTTKAFTNPTSTTPREICGRSFAKGRVISGRTSKAGQWPWQVNLKTRGHSTCGGSLITPEWVLTAAHCVNKPNAEELEVILGDLHRSRVSNNEQTFKVKYLIYHPDYVRPDNDIALLKLSKPAILNKYVQTVCLPGKNEKVAVGTKCYISGWGKTSPAGFFGSQELQHASLLVLNHTECEQRNSKLAPVTNRMICGANKGYNRQSGCHGDSGGPFVCQQTGGRWVLQGVVSWGSPKCDIKHGATVFAKVAAFRDWIDKLVKKFND